MPGPDATQIIFGKGCYNVIREAVRGVKILKRGAIIFKKSGTRSEPNKAAAILKNDIYFDLLVLFKQ
jgi:hypothetical protein